MNENKDLTLLGSVGSVGHALDPSIVIRTVFSYPSLFIQHHCINLDKYMIIGISNKCAICLNKYSCPDCNNYIYCCECSILNKVETSDKSEKSEKSENDEKTQVRKSNANNKLKTAKCKNWNRKYNYCQHEKINGMYTCRFWHPGDEEYGFDEPETFNKKQNKKQCIKQNKNEDLCVNKIRILKRSCASFTEPKSLGSK